MSTRLRRGIHTIEVQAPLAAMIGAWCLKAADVLPIRYAAYITMIGTACISVSRGLAKLGDPRLNGAASTVYTPTTVTRDPRTGPEPHEV